MATHADKIRCTIISPGAVDSELKESTSDQASSKMVNELYKVLAIPAESIARAVAYAIEQPADVDITPSWELGMPTELEVILKVAE
jgi:NADP-dependent 3-hydroxy acid dehydrogenase YdfG